MDLNLTQFAPLHMGIDMIKCLEKRDIPMLLKYCKKLNLKCWKSLTSSRAYNLFWRKFSIWILMQNNFVSHQIALDMMECVETDDIRKSANNWRRNLNLKCWISLIASWAYNVLWGRFLTWMFYQSYFVPPYMGLDAMRYEETGDIYKSAKYGCRKPKSKFWIILAASQTKEISYVDFNSK